MNERHFTDDALDDQLRRFYQDIYQPLEPAGRTWQKLVPRLDVVSPPKDDGLTTPLPSSYGSTMPAEATPYTRRTRPRIRSAVAVLVAGFIIIASLALFGGVPRLEPIMSRPGMPISTTGAYSTAGVPITPVATPGPQHTYVTNIVTSKGVSTDFVAIDLTSHFTAGEQVDVLCTVHVTKGTKHTVSIHWFYDGIDMQLPLLNGKTSVDVTSDQVVYFAMSYPTPGVGMAKLFFDLPSTDSGDQANDPYLAGQITFGIDPATAGSGGATPAGTVSASPT